MAIQSLSSSNSGFLPFRQFCWITLGVLTISLLKELLRALAVWYLSLPMATHPTLVIMIPFLVSSLPGSYLKFWVNTLSVFQRPVLSRSPHSGIYSITTRRWSGLFLDCNDFRYVVLSMTSGNAIPYLMELDPRTNST